jgi:hypothetical protein
MTKFKNLSLEYQAIKVYLLSLIVSLIFYYPFYKIYIYIFKPIVTAGVGMFSIYPEWFIKMFGSTIFAFYLFLPLFVFSLIKRKQWLVWFIGAVIPLLIALVGGTKDLFWALILSAIGWGLAKGILLIKAKKK